MQRMEKMSSHQGKPILRRRRRRIIEQEGVVVA